MADIETKDREVWTFHKIQQRANEAIIKKNAVTENLFVLGNGESRKDIDVELLKTQGKVWGCNAIFRDHVVDGLIAVDPMMTHEIYRSGYCDSNKVYFRDWDDMPADQYEMMKEAQSSNMKDPTIREWKSNPQGYYTHFVIHGQSTVNKNRKTDRWKGDGFENVYITWTYGLADNNITQLKDIMNDYYGMGWEADNAGPDDPGWSSGASAMYIACKVEKPKTCYLIGMDMYSTTDFINNLYKQTHGYVSSDESAITPQNWVVQMGRVMVRYKDIQFIKVNPDESNKISERMPQWDSLPNLSYMKKSEFYTKLSLDF
tara:strand:- start:313 stop:1260 length:948 start_codon:yes stop_codon:yes gene_type:complete